MFTLSTRNTDEHIYGGYNYFNPKCLYRFKLICSSVMFYLFAVPGCVKRYFVR